MPISWSAVDQSQDEDFAAQLAQQEVQQSLVFKLLQQKQQQDELNRRFEQEQYTRRKESDDTKYTRDFQERQFKSQEENRKADNDRAEAARKDLENQRAFAQFQAKVGRLAPGSTVSPAVIAEAEKFGLGEWFEKDPATGLGKVLESPKDRTERLRNDDRDAREARMARANEANIAAQTRRLQNEDRRLADQETRTGLMKQRADKLMKAGEALSPELRPVFKSMYDAAVKELKDKSGFMGFGESEPSEEDKLDLAERILNQLKSRSGQPAAIMSSGTKPPATPAPSGSSRFKVTVVK